MSTAGDASAFREVSGLVTFTPQGGANNNITLRVPYYLVPRPSSLVDVTVADSTPDSPSFTTTATVTNDADAAVAGSADFYAWGLRDGEDADGSPADMRAVGVQSFDIGGGNRLIGFGVSTWNRWSNASTTEFDIFVDVDPQNANGDDYIVVGVDNGAISAGRLQRPLRRVRLQHPQRWRKLPHRVVGGIDGWEHGLPSDPLVAALPCGRAVPQRGEPALQVPRDRVRSQRGGGRRHASLRELQPVDSGDLHG